MRSSLSSRLSLLLLIAGLRPLVDSRPTIDLTVNQKVLIKHKKLIVFDGNIGRDQQQVTSREAQAKTSALNDGSSTIASALTSKEEGDMGEEVSEPVEEDLVSLENEFFLYTPESDSLKFINLANNQLGRLSQLPSEVGMGVDNNATMPNSVKQETNNSSSISSENDTMNSNQQLSRENNNSDLSQAQEAHGDGQFEEALEMQRQANKQANGDMQFRGEKTHPHQRPYCLGLKGDFSETFDWICQGLSLLKLPPYLEPEPTSLRLTNTGIESLTRKSFAKYKDVLRDFSIENAPKLTFIEPGTFADLMKLRVVRISGTGLKDWPSMARFKQEKILTSLAWLTETLAISNFAHDLDSNVISSLGSEPINIRTELLNLEFNQIKSIEENTFNGSEIGVLSLSGNRYLNYIHPNAFANLKNLVKLDLSHTSVSQLPTVGLHQLRKLIIRDNYALTKIPSIYVFPMLEEAHLTYAYHCCSFRYPQTHDPSAYKEHLRLQEELNGICVNRKDQAVAVGDHIQSANVQASSSSKSTMNNNGPASMVVVQQSTTLLPATSTEGSEFEGFFDEVHKVMPVTNVADGGKTVASQTAPVEIQTAPQIILPVVVISNESGMIGVRDSKASAANSSASSSATTAANNQTGLTIAAQTASNNGGTGSGRTAANSSNANKLWSFIQHDIECGEIAIKYSSFPNITCSPEPDAFNPCEDIMGYKILRFAVWFVVGASIMGNLSVIIVLGAVINRLSVQKFLQLNLAIGDLFMGIYLGMLALADISTCGFYFNYAIDWQHGYGCNIAGAASLFASQLSIYTLSVITFERYYTITYSIDLNMRLQLGWAARIMFIGWIYAFTSAMLPIFADINSYNKTSICVPMRTTYLLDRVFIWFLIIIDSLAFLIIFVCYLRMYLLIASQRTQANAKETTVAMRMALLVITDFACWAPIIFFGTTAFFGEPLISVTNSKILIVFFYPLNSMANPFLYVISTRQYRRDLHYLASRWHMWRKNLFKSKTDSYYSGQNNLNYHHHHLGNPGGPMAYTNHYNQYYPASLNAQIGAVAAVTGVANHLKHNHLMPAVENCCTLTGANHNHTNGSNHGHSHNHSHHRHAGGLVNGLLCKFHRCGSASMKLHDQKVVGCNKNQYYVIRHQILPGEVNKTTRFNNVFSSDRTRTKRAPPPPKTSMKLKVVNNSNNRSNSDQCKTNIENLLKNSQSPLIQLQSAELGGDAQIVDHVQSSDSKIVNLSLDKGDESTANKFDNVEESSQTQQCPNVLATAKTGCCKSSGTRSRAHRSSCPLVVSCSSLRCSSNGSCCSSYTAVNQCCVCSTSTMNCLKCTKQQKRCRQPKGAKLSKLPEVASPNKQLAQQCSDCCESTSQGEKAVSSSTTVAAVDILGNISYNEPTSSISGYSSPPPLSQSHNCDSFRQTSAVDLRPTSCDERNHRKCCSRRAKNGSKPCSSSRHHRRHHRNNCRRNFMVDSSQEVCSKSSQTEESLNAHNLAAAAGAAMTTSIDAEIAETETNENLELSITTTENGDKPKIESILKPMKTDESFNEENIDEGEFQAAIHSLRWNPDGSILASGGKDKAVHIHRVTESELILDQRYTNFGHTNDIDQLCWNPENPIILATASVDKTIKIWDVRFADPVMSIKLKNENMTVCWSNDGATVAVADKADVVSFLDSRIGFKILKEQKFQFEVNEITWNKDNDLFFITSGDGNIHVLSYPDLQTQLVIDAFASPCVCIRFDPTGKYFAVGSNDAVASVWDSENLACIQAIAHPEWPIKTVSFSHDSRYLASGSEDLFIDVSDIATGQQVAAVETKKTTLTLDFHPKEYFLAYALDEKEHRDVGTIKVVGFPEHEDRRAYY